MRSSNTADRNISTKQICWKNILNCINVKEVSCWRHGENCCSILVVNKVMGKYKKIVEERSVTGHSPLTHLSQFQYILNRIGFFIFQIKSKMKQKTNTFLDTKKALKLQMFQSSFSMSSMLSFLFVLDYRLVIDVSMSVYIAFKSAVI